MINCYVLTPDSQHFHQRTFESGNDECVICTLTFKDKAFSITQAPCPGKHLFHTGCLNEWLNTKLENRNASTCPVCRHDIEKIRNPLKSIDPRISDEQIKLSSQRIFEMGLESNRELGSRVYCLQYAQDHGVDGVLPHLAQAHFEMGLEPKRELGSRVHCLQYAQDHGVDGVLPHLAQAHFEMGLEPKRELGSRVYCLKYAQKNGVKEALSELKKLQQSQTNASKKQSLNNFPICRRPYPDYATRLHVKPGSYFGTNPK